MKITEKNIGETPLEVLNLDSRIMNKFKKAHDTEAPTFQDLANGLKGYCADMVAKKTQWLSERSAHMKHVDPKYLHNPQTWEELEAKPTGRLPYKMSKTTIPKLGKELDRFGINKDELLKGNVVVSEQTASLNTPAVEPDNDKASNWATRARIGDLARKTRDRTPNQ